MLKQWLLLRKELKKTLKEDEIMEEEQELTPEMVADLLGVSIIEDNLKKAESKGRNSYQVKDIIYFYPPNDSYPKYPYKFYQNGKLIIDNQTSFSQIINLDEILLKMVKLFDKALENDIVIDPYSFVLKLTDPIKKGYVGKAELLMMECAVKNGVLNEYTFEEAKSYFLNMFLDNFMGYNFGESINRNEELREELNRFNQKVIDLNLREESNIECIETDTEKEEYPSIQHYHFPTKKEKVRKISKQ